MSQISKALPEIPVESLEAWMAELQGVHNGIPYEEKSTPREWHLWSEWAEVRAGRAVLRTLDGRLWWALDWGRWRRWWLDNNPPGEPPGEEVEDMAKGMIDRLNLEGVTVAALADAFCTVCDHDYYAESHQCWAEMNEENPGSTVLFFDRKTLDPACVFCWDCKKFVNVEAERQERMEGGSDE